MIRTTLRGACPSCGARTLFDGIYTLRDTCPECDQDLRGRDGAHYGGPIALGYGVGALAGFAALAALAATFGFHAWVAWVSVIAVILAILLSFRFCKAWWTWWLFHSGELGGGTP